MLEWIEKLRNSRWRVASSPPPEPSRDPLWPMLCDVIELATGTTESYRPEINFIRLSSALDALEAEVDKC